MKYLVINLIDYFIRPCYHTSCYSVTCVVKIAKGEMEQQIYKITKGFCLIINIINFDGNEDAKREDSEKMLS